MFRDLSFRYKIPLRGTVLILVTAIALTAALIFRAYDDLKQDLIANAEGISRVMAHTLVPALLMDDVWRTYEIIRIPFNAALSTSESVHAETILVLNNRFEVYAASEPQRFPMLTPVAASEPAYRLVQRQLAILPDLTPQILDLAGTESLYVATPIVSDGVRAWPSRW